jgi:cytochrome P450
MRRSPNPHFGFGAGPHRCLGSFVAKLEIRVALEEILRRYRSIRLDPDKEIAWECAEGLGIVALPLILEAAAEALPP